MSVNRERCSADLESACKGFRPTDWGVVSLLVRDMPPREEQLHEAHSYLFHARHIPEVGNFSHSEVRVWRVGAVESLLTDRTQGDFKTDDPDKDCHRLPSKHLDAGYYMKWRKKIEWRCKAELKPVDEA